MRWSRDEELIGVKNRCDFFKDGVLALLGMAMYGAAVAMDILAAMNDYKTGHTVYAMVAILLVFAPSVVFAIFMFVHSYKSYQGILAFCKACTFILLIPVLPSWPLIRGTTHVYHAVMGMFKDEDNRSGHARALEKKTSAYLLKFLQAFTASAPQLVLRLHKLVSDDDQHPFCNIGWIDIGQILSGMFFLSLTVVTTFNKSTSTYQLMMGDLELNKKLSFGTILLALVWWWCLLASRIPCLAIFIYTFEHWIIVLLLLHCLVVFLLQSITGTRRLTRYIFVFVSSAFLFIFAYIQINMENRMESSWIPYVLFCTLCLFEQTAMLASWLLVSKGIIPNILIIPSSPTNTTPSEQPDTTGSCDDGIYLGFMAGYGEFAIFIHYILFAVSVLFMAITLCTASHNNRRDKFDYADETDLPGK